MDTPDLTVEELETSLETLVTTALDAGIRPDLAEAIITSARYDSIRQEITDLWRYILPERAFNAITADSVSDRIEARALTVAVGELSQAIANSQPDPRPERPFALVPEQIREEIEERIDSETPDVQPTRFHAVKWSDTNTPQEPTC